jgi:hypothetical protein
MRSIKTSIKKQKQIKSQIKKYKTRSPKPSSQKKRSIQKDKKKTDKKKRSISKKEVCRREKIGTVMKEFKEKKLKLRNKQTVTNPKQAIAIALSIAKRNC